MPTNDAILNDIETNFLRMEHAEEQQRLLRNLKENKGSTNKVDFGALKERRFWKQGNTLNGLIKSNLNRAGRHIVVFTTVDSRNTYG